MNYVIKQFLLASVSCATISVLFNIQKKNIFLCAINGAICWTLYMVLTENNFSYIFSSLLCALLCGILGEFFARWQKTPVNCYFIIGVIPLVPGLKIYQSMNYFINDNLEMGATEAVQSLFMAIAIAVGLMIASSVSKIFRNLKTQKELKRLKKIYKDKNQ